MKHFRLEIRRVDRSLAEWNAISGIELIERIFGEPRPEPTVLTLRARTDEGTWVNISIPYEGEEGEASGWISADESGRVDHE